jgi:hypothetical protein
MMIQLYQNYRFAVMQNMNKDIACIQKIEINCPITSDLKLK